jgi:hypothetical protein
MVRLDRQIDLAARERRWHDCIDLEILREQIVATRYEILRRHLEERVTSPPRPLHGLETAAVA